MSEAAIVYTPFAGDDWLRGGDTARGTVRVKEGSSLYSIKTQDKMCGSLFTSKSDDIS